MVIDFSKPLAGNHYDAFEIEAEINSIVKQLHNNTIRVDGLFVNADAGFDTEDFRKVCLKHHIIANVPENQRNTTFQKDSRIIFDEEMYRYRFVIERTILGVTVIAQC